MNRIHEILNKAERDGTARRTRGLGEHQSSAAAVAPAPVTPAAIPRFHPGASEPDPAPWTPTATAPMLDPDAVQAALPTLDPRLVAAVAPQAAAAERYRMLRTRIKRAEHGRTVRSMLVTSPSKGDGKSLNAANLALTMAQEFHQRVLLLDADLRRPSIARMFGLPEGPGLTEVLMGVEDLEASLVYLPDLRLTILPAGAPPAQPAELLGSAAMRRTLDALRGRFDRILIDMPPVAPVADVHVLSPLTDALLMIIRAGSTPKPAIERALAGLDMSKVLGLVLNAANSGGDRYGDEGYHYYGG